MLSRWMEVGIGRWEVGLEQSKFYTLGCPRLYVATDHKPLVGILCDRALDTIANPRIVSIKERTL